jgi:hypothetical protein
VIELHPPTSGSGNCSVSFNGEVLVASSRDPEFAACRALLARGIRGKVKVIDDNTRRHRSTVDIERGAKLTCEEGAHGPHFVKYRETRVARPLAPEISHPREAA